MDFFPCGYLTFQTSSCRSNVLGASHIQTHTNDHLPVTISHFSSDTCLHCKYQPLNDNRSTHPQSISVSLQNGVGVDRWGAVGVSIRSPILLLQMDVISFENVLLGNQ